MSQESPYPPGLEWLLGGATDEAKLSERLCAFGKAQLVAIVLQLLSWITALRGQDKDLRARLAQNSGNSSRPSAPKSTRQKSGRKPGGQPGHPGVTLEKVKNPEYRKKCPLPEKCHCGRKLAHATVRNTEKRQVFDLPEPRPLEVTEYRADTVECDCGSGALHRRRRIPRAHPLPQRLGASDSGYIQLPGAIAPFRAE